VRNYRETFRALDELHQPVSAFDQETCHNNQMGHLEELPISAESHPETNGSVHFVDKLSEVVPSFPERFQQAALGNRHQRKLGAPMSSKIGRSLRETLVCHRAFSGIRPWRLHAIATLEVLLVLIHGSFGPTQHFPVRRFLIR